MKFRVWLFFPIEQWPLESINAAIIAEREIFNVGPFGEVRLGARPATIQMTMPRTRCHNITRVPPFDLIRQPHFAIWVDLLPGAEVVGVAGGKLVRVTEVFPS